MKEDNHCVILCLGSLLFWSGGCGRLNRRDGKEKARLCRMRNRTESRQGVVTLGLDQRQDSGRFDETVFGYDLRS